MALVPYIISGTILYGIYTYCRRRYLSPLASVPIAPANHFLIKYFGLVPPPNENDTRDYTSEFLIPLGQDAFFSPIAVCWSLFGKPLVIANTLKGIKDVLIDGPKSKVDNVPRVQRGDLICLIQNLVFGGKNINNTVGQVINKQFVVSSDTYLIHLLLGLEMASSYIITFFSTKTNCTKITSFYC